jgi:hypothetical protein
VNTLEAIINTGAEKLAAKFPLESKDKRMTTGEVLLNMQYLGQAIERTMENLQKLPMASPKQVDEYLKLIIEQAGIAQDKANKLLAANQKVADV